MDIGDIVFTLDSLLPILAYGNPFCEAFVLGKLFLEQLVLWNGFRRKPYVDGMRSIGYASAWSEMSGRFL